MPRNASGDRSPIRETYEEFDLGAVRVGRIADPDNEYAWIASDVVREVEQ